MLFVRCASTRSRRRFEKLTVSFADQEYQFQGNTIDYIDQDHAARNNRSANPLAGQFAVSGCSTKSQAGRIAVVRAREETGRHDPGGTGRRAHRLLEDHDPGARNRSRDGGERGGSGRSRWDRKLPAIQWGLNATGPINLQGKSVVASMYDVTTGPKPADVAPAPIPIEPPRDSGPPPEPVFSVAVSDLDSRVVQLSALTFADPMNTVTLNAGTWNFYYVDPGDTDYILNAALLVGRRLAHVGWRPVRAQLGRLSPDRHGAAAGRHHCRGNGCGDADAARQSGGGRHAVDRHGGFPRSQAHDARSAARRLYAQHGCRILALLQPLPSMRLVAVTGTVTNSYGDSVPGVNCTCNNGNHGLLLSADGVLTLNVNSDTHLPNGDLMVNVTANRRRSGQ